MSHNLKRPGLPNDVLAAGRRAVLTSADRILPKPIRVRIWTSFGPRHEGDGRSPHPGTPALARYHLERQCVLRVLPVWDSYFPHDDVPHRAMAAADRAAADRTRVEYALKACEESWLHSDNVAASLFDSDPARQYVASVGYAASRLAAVAVADEAYNESDLDDPAFLTFDPYTADPALLASWAAAKGSEFEVDSDPEARRGFWAWYLDHAVPQAYRRAFGDGRPG